MEPITPSPEQWDSFVRQQPRAHALQLAAWGTLKAHYGWQVERIAIHSQGQITAGAQLLFRPLPLRLGTMAYLPYGPYLVEPAAQAPLWQAIHACARRHYAAFLKWEPGFYNPDRPAGFRESPHTIQPSRTIQIDLTADEDEILARMNQGTRRKIRKSLKSDVRYYQAAREDVQRFTDIMQVTGARNEFGVHEPAYYQLAYDLFVPAGDAALILAEHDGDTLAGVMVFAVGEEAWYLYGASSSVRRNLMASYGVQWEAIRWAKARGCATYDMWGVPDEDPDTLEAQFQERSDGLWGVYGFKRGWGGQIMRSAGAWDRVYNGVVYTAYRAAARLRG